MPEHKFKKLVNGVYNPFEGTSGFSQQFWGEYTYAIQSDLIPSVSVFASLDKSGATAVHNKMMLSRNYDTFCPVQCGVSATKSPKIYYGGSASIQDRVRERSFIQAELASFEYNVFGYYIGGTYGNGGFSEIIAFKSSNNEDDGYTVGNPILYRESTPSTGFVEAPDLEIYLVFCLQTNWYYWCVRSVMNDYYHFWECDDGFNVAAEDDDTGEKEDDEVIPIPNLPQLGVENVGVRLYRAVDFSSFIGYMWGSDTLINGIRKLVGDETPYECIVACNVIPYGDAFPSYTASNIYVGNVDTGITAPRTSQYAEINFGSVTIPRRYNNALDFAPYTVVEIYLPFIGRVKLPTDFVMGKTLGVTYHMDCVTGGCFAYITTNDVGVIQCEGGSCLIQLPLTAQTANGARQAISSAMAAGVSFAGAASVGSTVTLPRSGRQITTYGESDVMAGTGQVMSGINQAWNALAAKDSYTTYGGLSLANGFLGSSNPIVYIHRPIDATPSGYNSIVGYASSEIANLGSLSGFTQVKSINLGIAGASEEDLAEIEMLLKEGVIL